MRTRSSIRVATVLTPASVLLVAAAAVIPASLHAQVTPAGPEFQANTYTTSYQYGPAVAAAANGDFVVVWTSYSQDGYGYGVFGQRYASGGSALGTEFQVNSYTTSDQTSAAVAAAANGDFVVVWESYNDGSGDGIAGQRYASSGSALGTEFHVNSYTTFEQATPAVAAAGNGDFVVVWTSDSEDGDDWGVFGQRYASSGGPLGTEFQVNTYTTSRQVFPAVAAAGNGDFVVVWTSYSEDGDGWGVFGQRYASSGGPLGTEFQVNTYTTSLQGAPAVAAAGNGDFVVVWQSYNDGSGDGISGRRYASNGSAVGSEFQVNTYTTNNQTSPAVATADDGDFVVVWASFLQDGDNSGVFGQRYASSGSALGSEFQVNTYTTSSQHLPAIAAASNGDFVVAWQSYHQDGDVSGVFGQRYSVPPSSCPSTPLPACTTPGKSLLVIKDKSPAGASAGDKLVWKWLKGPATAQADFGNPTMTAHYQLCIYTGVTQTLAVKAEIAPVNNWEAVSTKGYKYKDPTAGSAGISKILLKGSSTGKILLKGKDGQLDLTPTTLPFSGGVRVQLSNSDNSNCWETYFAASQKNTDAEFKAQGSTPDCSTGAGVNVGGVCWYLGASTSSCNDACSSVGGVCDPATTTYAGTGGTSAQCAAVLGALGIGTFNGDATGCGTGAGCAQLGTDGYRCTDVPTNCAAITIGERACACH